DEPLVLDRNLNGDSTAVGPGDQRLFYHQNGLYSVFALSDDAGVVVEGYEYDAYGEHVVLDASFGNPQRRSPNGNSYMFTGQRSDTETGLIYYKNRYYSASLGRFISRDPSNLYDAANQYAYVESNPIKFTDPFGLQYVQVWDMDVESGTWVPDPMGEATI